MSEQLSFLAAIKANPGDDSAKLVYAEWLQENGREQDAILLRCRTQPWCDDWRLGYADWLDEQPTKQVQCGRCKGSGRTVCPDCVHWRGRVPRDCLCRGKRRIDCPTCKGIGTISDPLNAARAELIRVQCELARTRYEGCCDKNGNGLEMVADAAGGGMRSMRVVRCGCRRSDLLYRGRELLAALDHTRPKCPAHHGVPCTFASSISCPACWRSGYVGTWERGLFCVRVPRLADVWEQDAYGDLKPFWRLTSWASALATLHPDTVEVWCEDREPERGIPNTPATKGCQYSYDWVRESEWYPVEEPDALPAPLFDVMLAQMPDHYYHSNQTGTQYLESPTPEAARLALARAVACSLFDQIESVM